MSGEMCIAPANLYVKTLADANKKIESMSGNYNLTSYPAHLSDSTIAYDAQHKFAGSVYTSKRFKYNSFEQGNEAYLQTCANPSGCSVKCMDINGDGNFDTCMENRPDGDTVINDEQGELVVRECSTDSNKTTGRFYNMNPSPIVVYGQLTTRARNKNQRK